MTVSDSLYVIAIIYDRRITRGQGQGVISKSGAKLDVCGFVSAYDARTSERDWRFYTIPADPSKLFEKLDLKESGCSSFERKSISFFAVKNGELMSHRI